MTKAMIRVALTLSRSFPTIYARLLPMARRHGLIGCLTLCKKG